jgi:hypothetical protein
VPLVSGYVPFKSLEKAAVFGRGFLVCCGLGGWLGADRGEWSLILTCDFAHCDGIESIATSTTSRRTTTMELVKYYSTGGSITFGGNLREPFQNLKARGKVRATVLQFTTYLSMSPSRLLYLQPEVYRHTRVCPFGKKTRKVGSIPPGKLGCDVIAATTSTFSPCMCFACGQRTEKT